MKIPEKFNNIYPKTKKNIKHLINYYFDDLEPDRNGVVDYILSKTSLSLNQIEFIVQKTAENYYFFIQNFSDKSLVNFLKSSVEVLTKEPNQWNGSNNRILMLTKIKTIFENQNKYGDDYFIGTPFIIENAEAKNLNKNSKDEENRDEEYFDNRIEHENDNFSDENDYERDSFYALTDGQYGDYDEWQENGGNLDDLMDELGN